jgi:hypothetical protein
MEEERKLPTFRDIQIGDIAIPGKLNALNVLLNQEPPEVWVKQHPIAKNVQYIPIDKIEYLLTKIFIVWYPEVKECKMVANSILTVIRLHYQNPITGQMEWTDGVGAANLQVNAGEKASDFDKIKFNAVEIAAPKSKSAAIKDAAENLGKIFGKDLNRKDTLGYDSLLNTNRFENAKAKEV